MALLVVIVVVVIVAPIIVVGGYEANGIEGRKHHGQEAKGVESASYPTFNKRVW